MCFVPCCGLQLHFGHCLFSGCLAQGKISPGAVSVEWLSGEQGLEQRGLGLLGPLGLARIVFDHVAPSCSKFQPARNRASIASCLCWWRRLSNRALDTGRFRICACAVTRNGHRAACLLVLSAAWHRIGMDLLSSMHRKLRP
jgi:hypothetical protein